MKKEDKWEQKNKGEAYAYDEWIIFIKTEHVFIFVINENVVLQVKALYLTVVDTF